MYIFYNSPINYLTMRNISDKNFRENQNKHFMSNVPPLPTPENFAVYELN